MACYSTGKVKPLQWLVKMSEDSQLIICIGILIGVYILTWKVHLWRIKRTYERIIRDLEQKGAVDPSSAVELPYAKARVFRVGMRDYRQKALEYLILSNIVGMTEGDRYYLKDPKVRSIDPWWNQKSRE